MSSPISFDIHPLRTHEEFAGAVRLQKEIWGFQDVELLPIRLFVVASKVGGQVLGAFHGNQMAAFCLCIPGLKPGGKAYLHSHMLGVLPEHRNSGLGRQMKWKQREFALAEGIDLIEWTFDPLEIKNAFFNIERLGAVVRRYVHNQYGTTTSHLHGGLPTDRLTAEWWIKSARVQAMATGVPALRPNTEAKISVPAQITELRQNDRAEARRIQARIADEFGEFFGAGLAVVGFSKSTEAGTYLLGAWDSN